MNKFALGFVMLGLSTGSVMVAGKAFDKAVAESMTESTGNYVERLKMLELWFNAYFASLKGTRGGTMSDCAKLADHQRFLIEDWIYEKFSFAKEAVIEIKDEMARKNAAGIDKAKADFDLLKGYNQKLYDKLKAPKLKDKVKGDWLTFADPVNIGEYGPAVSE